MNSSRAFLAGLIAGLAMTIIAAIGRAFGMPLDVEMMLGTMFGFDAGETGTWILGFVIHLMLSGLIALLYAWGFEHITKRAGWGIGTAFSVVHIIIGGLMMGVVPFIHPMIPEAMAAPGIFVVNLGTGAVIFFLIEHLVYGALVGGIYATGTTTLGQRHTTPREIPV